MKFTLLLLLLCFGLACESSAQISFTPLPAQPPDHVLSIVTNPSNGIMYSCTWIRVSQSSDNGITWTKTANTGSIGINTLYCTSAGQLYAGVDATLATPAAGLISYNNITSTWSPVLDSPVNVTAIIEDNVGNIIVGTGTTGNFKPNPITYGTGAYLYNGSTWTPISAGIANLEGYAVLPAIKMLMKSSTGTIFAATYGNGVLTFNGSSWSAYGSSLGNLNISSLAFAKDGTLLAGTDNGVFSNSGTSWSSVSSSLPNKPVRALASDKNGNVFAGLGYYQWMDGALVGEIFVSSDSGKNWHESDARLQTSDILCLTVNAANEVFAGAAGIWRSSDSGATWRVVRDGQTGANQVSRIIRNSRGDLFTICDNQPKYLGYGGVFRSTDNGATWTQQLNGIQRHRGNFIFCDSKDNLWAGFTTMSGAGSNGSHTNGALYTSTDNGETWVQNTSILTPSLRFVDMKESKTGKLYVINGWGGPSNISSSSDYATWNNTLNQGASNGGMAFALAINPTGDVFIGTETEGVQRSLNDGTSTFTTVSPKGGNNSVFVDQHTGFVFAGIPGGANGVYFHGSAPADNGTNMFQFSTFPAYTAPSAMVFDNRGNMYLTAQSSGAANVGFYVAQSPWNATTTFTRVMANANVSYYFSSMMIDPCGYIYGAQAGGGISRSTMPVNTPAMPILQSPSDGTIGESQEPTLKWLHSCTLDSLRLQVSTNSEFTDIIHDVALSSASYYTVPAGILFLNSKYFWRVRAVNSVGAGAWTEPFSFRTGTTSVTDKKPLVTSIPLVTPNPAEGNIIINTESFGMQYSIKNVMGQTLLTGILPEKRKSVDIELLPSGIYFLVVQGLELATAIFIKK